MSEGEEIPVNEELEQEFVGGKPPKKDPDTGKVLHKFFGNDGTKKFRPSAAMRVAIFQVLGRQRIGYQPDYKNVAEEHKVNIRSLQKFVQQYKKGMIDLGDPPNMAQKKELDIRAENERSLLLLRRYEHLINNVFEKQLGLAEKETKAGNLQAFAQLNIPKTLSELAGIRDLRIKLEKGVMLILEKLMAMQNAKELAGATMNIQNNVSITMPSPVNGEKNPGPATAASQVNRAEIELRGDELEIHQILGTEKEFACDARSS